MNITRVTRALIEMPSELYDDYILVTDDSSTYREFSLGTKDCARELVYEHEYDLPGHPCAEFFEEVFTRLGSTARETELVLVRSQ